MMGRGYLPEVSRVQSPCHFGYGRFQLSETDSSGVAGRKRDRWLKKLIIIKPEKAFKQ